MNQEDYEQAQIDFHQAIEKARGRLLEAEHSSTLRIIEARRRDLEMIENEYDIFERRAGGE